MDKYKQLDQLIDTALMLKKLHARNAEIQGLIKKLISHNKQSIKKIIDMDYENKAAKVKIDGDKVHIYKKY